MMAKFFFCFKMFFHLEKGDSAQRSVKTLQLRVPSHKEVSTQRVGAVQRLAPVTVIPRDQFVF